ncbi:ParB/Srx family N-terminal domain-containing protein [Methylobacterium nodulans]|uniref:ParB domain protein nuclease n=1 Tax=Methylobacterium nodulans (strain LMG 21967 / CNCM I-2342 / ORS 2060) TaxID=460265 RepID=B8IIT8_METNO|nr:ParB/Srx family N-terminal domain-containing protein [Methylobacterium nodulans]ACL61733.1 ParB domain protein nuclease [Methylobacterium nodulans ORS 2060]
MKEQAAPRITLRALDSLKAYERNARRHSREQIEQLKSSIENFGWTNPILADANGIVAGHARSIAARELYAAGASLKFANGAPIPEGKVPVVDCTGWSDAQRRAYILADNQLSLNATWDDDLLRVEFKALQDEGFDTALTGFTAEAIGDLFTADNPPAAFGSFDEDVETEHKCPKCGYQWSGKVA